MKKFPDPIRLPSVIEQERKKRHREVVRSAGFGVLVRLLIIAVELTGVYFFGSIALLLDALSSLLDVGSSFLLIASMRYAARPPDKNHPFGHGRFEPLIGLQLGLFLVVLGGYLLVQQTLQITEPSESTMSQYAWLVPLFAVVLLEITYRSIIRMATKHNSPALAADAVHYRIDALTSFVAAGVLLIGAFYPQWSHRLDHMGALCISLIMVVIGLKAARENLNQLLDRVPAKEYFELVEASALSVEGVLGTEKIRIQLYGPDAHVDIDIEVNPESTVEVAHEVSQLVRAEIQRRWPVVRDVTVHIEPYYPNDH